MSQQPSSNFPALVRGMRTLLVVQLLVAVIAFAATGWALWKLPDLTQRIATLNADIERREQQRDDLEDQLERTTAASSLLMQGLELGRTGNWTSAVERIALAQATDPENPLFLRELAEAEYRAGQYDAAITHIRETRAKSGDEVVPRDFVLEATYECAARRPERAEQALRDPLVLEAARTDPTLVSNNDMLFAACPGTLHSYLRQLTGALESAPEAVDENAFRIRTVFIHIRRPADRDAARQLREHLRAAGYSVPPIVQVVDTELFIPNVRYYYGAQAEEAQRIAGLVRQGASQAQIAAWSASTLNTISLEGRYQGLPTGTAEVWLGPAE